MINETIRGNVKEVKGRSEGSKPLHWLRLAGREKTRLFPENNSPSLNNSISHLCDLLFFPVSYKNSNTLVKSG